MDTLTFNSPLLLRHLTFSEAKKAPISEINLKVVLQEMKMDMEQVSLTPSIRTNINCDLTRDSLPVYRVVYPSRL